MTKAAFITNFPGNVDYVYGFGRRAKLEGMADFIPGVVTEKDFMSRKDELKDVEVLFSTWGMFSPTEEMFAAMPKLKALFYGAGATNHFAPAFLAHNIKVSSAWIANAIPVAQFAAAQILLGLKGYFLNTRNMKSKEAWCDPQWRKAPCIFEERVVLIGAGAISTKLVEMLSGMNLDIVVIPSRKERRTMSLEEGFRTGFVVSNHLPNRDDNKNVITEEHFRSMRYGATFINTGRGAQIDEAGMIRALKDRPDLTALLDVTWPEPPENGSELYTLPNVQLSSHIAGSMNNEVVRMADYMIDEFNRFSRGENLKYAITEDMLK